MPFQDVNCQIDTIDWSVGWEKFDQRTTYEFIQDELHEVPDSYPYCVRLKEQPYKSGGVIVTGYTVITSMPTIATQVYADYEDSRLYFHSTEAGKMIKITYYGMGSAIIANDVNRFADFFNILRNALKSFMVESCGNKKVRIYGGYSVQGSTLSKLKEMLLDFGTSGNYESSAMSTNYFRRILVGVNQTSGTISITEGVEALTRAGATIPAIPTSVKPCALVTVHDNGSAGAGTISTIEESDIEDARTFIG